MRDKSQWWMSLVWGVALLALVLNTVVATFAVNDMVRNDILVNDSHALRRQLIEVLSDLKDAETGQRGYLLSGREDYLKPYHEALQKIDKHQAALRAAYSPSAKRSRDLDELESMIAERIAILKKSIEVRRRQGLEAALEEVVEDIGKAKMDAIRALLQRIQDEEAAHLQERIGTARTKYRTTYLTSLLGGGLTLAMTVLAFVLARRQLRRRSRAEQTIQSQAASLERLVEERTAALHLANIELTRSNQDLEQFAYIASHDLQEPLRKIQAFGDRLQHQAAEALSEPGLDYLRRILVSAARMRDLINDLLMFSRVSTHGQTFAEVALEEVAALVLGDLEILIQQVGATVEVGPCQTIQADPLQMRQLLQNLIGNALKFHKPNTPPTIRIGTEEIEAAGLNGKPRRWCRLTVADDGIGFDEKYLDRIFQVFQRLHGRHEYEGTGVGLAICRKIAERHGGQITARSKPAEGATFLVTLPIHQHSA